MLPLLIGLQFLFPIPFGGSFILLVPLHNGTKSHEHLFPYTFEPHTIQIQYIVQVCLYLYVPSTNFPIHAVVYLICMGLVLRINDKDSLPLVRVAGLLLIWFPLASVTFCH